MPDLERIMDSLSIFMAPNAESREYARGYIAGKSRARIEVVIVLVSLYFIIAIIGNLANI